MGKINMRRVLLGAVLMGVTFIVIELVIEGIIGIIGPKESEMLLEVAPFATLSGARYHIVNFSYFFLFCVLAVWVCAAMAPRFGPGPKTGLIVAGVFWFTGVLMAVNFVNMGIFPVKLTVTSLLFNLVELPPALVIGASVYRESEPG